MSTAGDNPFEPPSPDADRDSEPSGAIGGARLASLGARLGASIVDGMVAAGATWLLAYAMVGFFADTNYEVFLLYVSLAVPGVFIGLNAYHLARRGQTIGKRALGIRIVNVTDDRTASFLRIVFLRMLPFQLLVLIPHVGPYVAMLDVLFIFRKDRRCVHDLVAGTRVVVVNP